MFCKRLVCLPLCLFLLAGAARADEPRHERLHTALYELRAARQEIKDTKMDFGGHRAKALRAVDDAITSLKTILRVKSDDAIRRVDRKREFYRRFKDFPRLRQAVRDLRDARKELKESKTDFGGLKKRALGDIDRAVEQIDLALSKVRPGR